MNEKKDYVNQIIEDEDTNAELILDNILKDLTNNEYININLNENNNIIIQEKWETFILTTTKTQTNLDDILECENLLKTYYEIPKNKIFIYSNGKYN